MSTWVLILFIHASVMSSRDSVALTNVPGFKSAATCNAAGEQAKSLTTATFKATKFVCLEVKP